MEFNEGFTDLIYKTLLRGKEAKNEGKLVDNYTFYLDEDFDNRSLLSVRAANKLEFIEDKDHYVFTLGFTNRQDTLLLLEHGVEKIDWELAKILKIY